MRGAARRARARDGHRPRARSLGRARREQRHVHRKFVRVYPRIAPAAQPAAPACTHRRSIGDYVSPALGEGIEPGDIRQFAPGDRIRQVNWRASLRLGTLYVTQHHRERNADVVLMLDTLADVGPPRDGTLDLAVRAAASLAAAYLAAQRSCRTHQLRRDHRLGQAGHRDVHSTSGSRTRCCAPPSSSRTCRRTSRSCRRACCRRTRSSSRSRRCSTRASRRPPSISPRAASISWCSPSRPWRSRARTLDGAPANDLACRLWRLERAAALDEFRRHGIAVIEWRPSDPLELALAGQGRRRPSVVAAG